MSKVELTKTCVDLESDLIERFKEIYPQHGAVKWFFNEALRCFVEIHDPERIDDEIHLSVQRAIGNVQTEETEE